MRSCTKALIGVLGSFTLMSSSLLAQTSSAGSSAKPPLVKIVGFEVYEHRDNVPLAIRWEPSDVLPQAITEVAVHVIVDPSGRVASALADKKIGWIAVPAKIRSRAEAVVRAIQYRPFERQGHPVWATFEDYIQVLRPELIPTKTVPFPTVRDWNSVRITLVRTTCFGRCPSYRVEIRGNGTVLYEGRMYVVVTGSHRTSLSKESVVELVNDFGKANYYSLNDEYKEMVTDMPTYETSIEIDGQRKTVKDYAGQSVGMPLSVSKLEAEIDRLAETVRWTRGNENTIRSLRQESWDFKSSEAADTLVRAAQFGNPDLVRDLMAAGVPLKADKKDSVLTELLMEASGSGIPEKVEQALSLHPDVNGRAGTEGRTALMIAAYYGGEVVRLLLEHGADPNLQDKEGETALLLCSQDPDAARLLINYGANVNAQNRQGLTALMNTNSIEVARVLIENGADLYVQDLKGKTALDYAKGNRAKAALLEAAQAKRK